MPKSEFGVGLDLAVIVLLFCFAGPLVWRQSPLAVNLAQALQGPSLSHPFGTDDIGRDVLARTMVGGQLDVLVAVVVTIAGGVVGMAIGVVAAMNRGVVDLVIMRVLDALLAVRPFRVKLGGAVDLGPAA